jgi:hypothetical protein
VPVPETRNWWSGCADKRGYAARSRTAGRLRLGAAAALLDVCLRLELLDEAGHRTAKAILVRIVAMLIKLAQSCEE